jgi:hypothetical protein
VRARSASKLPAGSIASRPGNVDRVQPVSQLARVMINDHRPTLTTVMNTIA